MSKWDKLITHICNLSKDLRFEELRNIESYGYEMNALEAEVVIIRSENRAVCQLQYRSMNQSRKFMWKWCGRL